MKVPERWGLCFAGNEQAFCDALLAAGNGPTFDYIEIGVACGDGLRATAEFLAQTELEWRVFGVDIENGWSLHKPQIEENLGALLFGYLGRPGQAQTICPPHGAVVSLHGSAAFLSRSDLKPNFVFIDGCHGAPCVMNDFIEAEKVLAPGGVICFHDADEECQGGQVQLHCQTGIAVRFALEQLGLLDNERPGWRKIAETTGDKSRGGHGCFFAQRQSTVNQ